MKMYFHKVQAKKFTKRAGFGSRGTIYKIRIGSLPKSRKSGCMIRIRILAIEFRKW